MVFVDGKPALSMGTKVVFHQTHHAMNPQLKLHEGEIGIVKHHLKAKGQYLVEFPQRKGDPVGGCWWIKNRYLEPVTDV